MSESPRTDAMMAYDEEGYATRHHGQPEWADFARTLERELAAMRERAETAERERDVARYSLKAVIENGGAGERLDKVVRERDAMRAALRDAIADIESRDGPTAFTTSLRAALGEEAT